jgi:hypothetical protein
LPVEPIPSLKAKEERNEEAGKFELQAEWYLG